MSILKTSPAFLTCPAVVELDALLNLYLQRGSATLIDHANRLQLELKQEIDSASLEHAHDIAMRILTEFQRISIDSNLREAKTSSENRVWDWEIVKEDAVADGDDEALRVAFDAENWARRFFDFVVALDEGTG